MCGTEIKIRPPHDVVNMGRPDDVPKHVQYRGTTQIACRFIYVLYKGKPLDRPVTGAKRSRLLRTRRFACPAWGRQTAGHALPVFSYPGSLERTSARGTPPHCIWYQYITPPQRYCQVLCGGTVIFRRFYAFRICLICSRFSANQIPSCRSFVEARFRSYDPAGFSDRYNSHSGCTKCREHPAA